MPTKAQKLAEKTEAVATLRKWLKDDQVVYCILRNRAASGMSHTIALVVFTEDTRPVWIGNPAARATGHIWDDKHEGVRIRGGGMDMGFALVDDLAHAAGLKLRHRWL